MRRSRVRKWVAAALIVLLLILVLLALPTALTTTIIPPTDVENPTDVIVMDYSHTGTLILPSDDGKMIAYAFGDFDFYARRRRTIPMALRALFWPTRGTLSRWVLAGPLETENVRRQVHFHIENLHVVRVDQADVERLRERLERLYRQQARQQAIQWPDGPTFVPHPDSYTYFHNSNHAVAGWLKELRCGIRGPAVYSRWRVGQPHR